MVKQIEGHIAHALDRMVSCQRIPKLAVVSRKAPSDNGNMAMYTSSLHNICRQWKGKSPHAHHSLEKTSRANWTACGLDPNVRAYTGENLALTALKPRTTWMRGSSTRVSKPSASPATPRTPSALSRPTSTSFARSRSAQTSRPAKIRGGREREAQLACNPVLEIAARCLVAKAYHT